MKTYKVVGWYNETEHDETSTCYSLRVDVRAENRYMAFDLGDTALTKAGGNPRHLLNWYVQEVREPK